MTFPAGNGRRRVAVRTHTGRTELGWATDPSTPRDGKVYAILDQGSQGNFPAEDVTEVEDKDAPRAGMETK